MYDPDFWRVFDHFDQKYFQDFQSLLIVSLLLPFRFFLLTRLTLKVMPSSEGHGLEQEELAGESLVIPEQGLLKVSLLFEYDQKLPNVLI